MYWCTCISSWYRQPAAQAARPGLLVAGAHAACRAGPEQRRAVARGVVRSAGVGQCSRIIGWGVCGKMDSGGGGGRFYFYFIFYPSYPIIKVKIK